MEKPKQITRLWHTADEQPEVNARGNARICVMRQYGNGETVSEDFTCPEHKPEVTA